MCREIAVETTVPNATRIQRMSAIACCVRVVMSRLNDCRVWVVMSRLADCRVCVVELVDAAVRCINISWISFSSQSVL